jgi:hypothetical protein
MFRDDYISRQIQIFVQILARILGLTKGREFMDALALLQMTFREQLGTDLNTFLTVPDDRMVDFLTFGQTEVVALTRSGLAVALLQAAAHLYQAQSKEDQGLPYLQKALNLLLEIELAGEEPLELPEFVPTVDDLIEDVDLHRLTLDSRGTLVFYFEREGEYATAEKVLNMMLADRPDDQEIHDLAVSFYEYLLDESDEQLAEGGLPREQVITALEQLRTSRTDS